ncbi:hypothetical protein ACFLUP_02210 [Chloroflexota bacterium]
MTRIDWKKRASDLTQELTFIRRRASISTGNFQECRKQVERSKVQFLAYQIEAKRKFLARSRGVASVAKDRKGLPAILGIAAAASVLAGIITKDASCAANGGLSGLSGALQGLGETDWVICLGKQVAVVSRDNITPGRVWLTLDSVKATLKELEQKAQNGAHLGNLDAIFLEMPRNKKLVFTDGQAIEQVKTAG